MKTGTKITLFGPVGFILGQFSGTKFRSMRNRRENKRKRWRWRTTRWKTMNVTSLTSWKSHDVVLNASFTRHGVSHCSVDVAIITELCISAAYRISSSGSSLDRRSTEVPRQWIGSLTVLLEGLKRWYLVLGGVAVGRGFAPIQSDLKLFSAKIINVVYELNATLQS
jgi:hypothetical protein